MAPPIVGSEVATVPPIRLRADASPDIASLGQSDHLGTQLRWCSVVSTQLWAENEEEIGIILSFARKAYEHLEKLVIETANLRSG